MSMDPAVTNPDVYKVVFENERVRVLEYRDQPGHRTTPHQHPDSVMHTLSSFRRRLIADGQEREVEVLLLGPQGSGKGTQAQRIAAEFEIPHIATGDIIRSMKEDDSPLGR